MNHLRWQCRRGTKELDAVLCGFLDSHYAVASSAEQTLFNELLTLEDNHLLAYFFADSLPEKEGLKQLVEKIRCTFVV
ncbi:MAG: succinate dehydrogenase assembly factor 2 [Gammaproteobacteria bacterium]|nr:MAG: succinate dehydrogenase assembly factor 2 [Gammaproteobacteria bacterium]